MRSMRNFHLLWFFRLKFSEAASIFYEIFEELTNNNLIGTVTPFKCETDRENDKERVRIF